jgi:hypothetical protein
MAERSKHISSSFEAALYGLKNDVLMMSRLTDRIFQAAMEGLLNRDSVKRWAVQGRVTRKPESDRQTANKPGRSPIDRPG